MDSDDDENEAVSNPVHYTVKVYSLPAQNGNENGS